MTRPASMRSLMLLLVVCCSPALSQEAHREIIREKLQADLEAVIRDYEGVAGLHIVDLASGDRWAIRDELQFPQASAIKVPILIELFRRAESEPELLTKRIEMTDDVRTLGSGVLRYLTDGGSSLSLEDYAIYMIL
ncbi:MAG: class A beta-lactamase-related serine hydrolase, partial [Gammaproteobacteria bacterium]|nr:class A beta-lactamase-related serine hydrolase [Gammaproteobacteria bacterium]